MPPEVLSRHRRTVEREGRRRRRREGRERGGKGESEEHRQGMSTDDELLEMNRLKFQSDMCELTLSPPLLTPTPSPTHSPSLSLRI